MVRLICRLVLRGKFPGSLLLRLVLERRAVQGRELVIGDCPGRRFSRGPRLPPNISFAAGASGIKRKTQHSRFRLLGLPLQAALRSGGTFIPCVDPSHKHKPMQFVPAPVWSVDTQRGEVGFDALFAWTRTPGRAPDHSLRLPGDRPRQSTECGGELSLACAIATMRLSHCQHMSRPSAALACLLRPMTGE